MKPTFSGYSTDHRSGFGLLVVEANPDQDGWALNAFGLHSKKRKMLVLIPEENALQEPVKTVGFKPTDFRGFRNVAETSVLGVS